MRQLERLNLKDPSTIGRMEMWYGWDRPGAGIVWSRIPEPGRRADYGCVVETKEWDEVLVRFALAVYRGNAEAMWHAE
jgi:hypothetical protein